MLDSGQSTSFCQTCLISYSPVCFLCNSWLRRLKCLSKRMNYLKLAHARKVTGNSLRYPIFHSSFPELFDLSTRIEQDSQPELRAALGETVNTTQALITKFVQLAEDKKSSILKSEAFSECQNAQNEVHHSGLKLIFGC